MLDSNGSSGGVAPSIYDVIRESTLLPLCHREGIYTNNTAGKNTSCLPSPPTSQFTVQANVTATLKTCQPWGLTIKGGVQPYTVSLAALDSPIITNTTLGVLDDVFTYIDRADPNTQLIGAYCFPCVECSY